MPAASGRSPVAVRILHVEPWPGAGRYTRLLAGVRRELATAGATTFRAAGAGDVAVVSGPADGVPFGRRLAWLREEAVAGHGPSAGLVVLGSGAVPLLRVADARRFIDAAAASDRVALANNAYSADIVAIARLAELPDVPELPADNALPRWLTERAGWRVADLRHVARLSLDVDSPLDAALLDIAPASAGPAFERVCERLAQLRSLAADPRAELTVFGRASARSLALLERRARCRVRAIVEERGLRASSALALGEPEVEGALAQPRARVLRPPRSVLGLLLDLTGPEAIAGIAAGLGDGALVDTRVLLAHRLGADEASWPCAEDRYASDLLDPEAIADPWLRAFTAAAASAPVPVLLGGHSLVGPGVAIALGLHALGRPARSPSTRPRSRSDRAGDEAAGAPRGPSAT